MPTLSNDHLSVAMQAAGAELTSIRDASGRELLWQADPAVWGRHAPILFPIVGRLPGDAYVSGGVTYRLGQHGFARDRDFAVVAHDDAHVTFALAADAASRAVYPFDFRLTVDYRLDGARLVVSYVVKNAGGGDLPFSIGAHPALRCPWDPNDSFDDYELAFDRPLYVARQLLAGGLRSGAMLPWLDDEDTMPLAPILFKDDAIVLADNTPRAVTLRHRRRGGGVMLTTLEPAQWPYYGIWSKPDRDGVHHFVCLEPWCGVASRADDDGELATKDGIMRLAPGAERRFVYAIEVLA